MATCPVPTVTSHAARPCRRAGGGRGDQPAGPGLRALGSRTEHGHVVALEADNLADSFRGGGIVRLVDRRSRRLDHDQPETGLRGSPHPQDRAAG